MSVMMAEQPVRDLETQRDCRGTARGRAGFHATARRVTCSGEVPMGRVAGRCGAGRREGRAAMVSRPPARAGGGGGGGPGGGGRGGGGGGPARGPGRAPPRTAPAQDNG